MLVKMLSKRYKLACVPIEDTDQPVHSQSGQSSMDILWGAKGPTFLRSKTKTDQIEWVRRLICIFPVHTCQLVPYAGYPLV